MEELDGITPALRRVLAAKQDRREALARLPFPEKVEVVIQLQQMAAPIWRSRGKIVRVWPGQACAYIVALQDAALGGPAQTAIKNARRAELCALMRLLANYIGAIANGDMSILLLSGFPHQKPTYTTIGPMRQPIAPRVVQGPHSGTLAAATVPIYGAGTYNWRVSLRATPLVYVQTAQTTGARFRAHGLVSGETYLVAVNAVGAAGPGDYSDNGVATII